MGRRKTIFFPPKYKKYAKIITIANPRDARKAANKMVKEFRKAKTRAKKVRLKKMVVLAANRAKALLKKKNISPKERSETMQVYRIYREAAEKMQLPPRK